MAPPEQTYDIVIVGAGPSAAGLVRGLLLQILECRKRGGEGGDVRVAVLERGAGSTSHGASDVQKTEGDGQKKATNDNSPRFGHEHPSTRSLREWFTAAHYTSRPSNRMSATSNDATHPSPAPPTTLHATSPQPHLHNRILDVPTGSGWGGTTNIHAGLVMEPDFERDFGGWPGRWKGGGLMKGAVEEVLMAMKEEGALTIGSLAGRRQLDESEREVDGPGEGRSFVEVFSEGQAPAQNALDWCGKFHEAVTSLTGLSSKEQNDSAGSGRADEAPVPATRANYFTALVEPLLQRHPELESNVVFLSGIQAERVLVGGDGVRSECNEACLEQHRAYAVECLVSNGTGSSNKERMMIRSKHEIVLCAGAIGSPALLLASGIGHEDDLKEAGVSPWYEQVPSERCSGSIPHSLRWLPVGHNLRDHVVLPRTFITPRQRQGTASRNSIHGWWLFDHAGATIQLQLADGIQMDKMIPHFASAALRRRWRLPFVGCELPVSWVHSPIHSIRRLLQSIFDHPPFREWTRLHTASVNVCLLKPQSTGKVTLVRNSTGALPARLSECRVSIDPGYLSDPRDMEALWTGWKATNDIKQSWFGGCIEILPGVALVVLFSAISYLCSMFRWLVWPLWDSLPDAKKARDDAPAWFNVYAAEFTNPYYHWCGTCAMGEVSAKGTSQADTQSTDAESAFVVDERLCVQSIAGLRVCDASVLPCCVSAPTALTCAGLGRAASSLLLLENSGEET